MIQIAIAEDEALFRKGMIVLLEGEDDLQVSLEAGDGQELLDQPKLYTRLDLLAKSASQAVVLISALSQSQRPNWSYCI